MLMCEKFHQPMEEFVHASPGESVLLAGVKTLIRAMIQFNAKDRCSMAIVRETLGSLGGNDSRSKLDQIDEGPERNCHNSYRQDVFAFYVIGRSPYSIPEVQVNDHSVSEGTMLQYMYSFTRMYIEMLSTICKFDSLCMYSTCTYMYT